MLAEVLAGRVFSGDAAILGRPYATAYAPVTGADGTVVGALFVGLAKD